jgi:septum formation protein
MPIELILGSSSRYRRELLERLRIPFNVCVPNIDEAPLAGEQPLALAERLAFEKASAVSNKFPNAWVIGSDQVAVCNGRAYGKPGDHSTAVQMLQELSGRVLQFHTALCLMQSSTHRHQLDTVTIEVKFRELSLDHIEKYLRADQPYDCAGAAKSEGLGITLMEYIRGDDTTALVGLPLISLCNMLRNWGFEP